MANVAKALREDLKRMNDQSKISEQELKPCPFCGGEVIERQDSEGGAWVEHKAKHKIGHMLECVLINSNVERFAVAEWNTRKPPVVEAGEGVDKEDIDYAALDILYHVEQMYPYVWSAMTKSCRMSVKNTIIQKFTTILKQKGFL